MVKCGKWLIQKKKIKGRWEDIAPCMCLHNSGPRAYGHLYQKGFPLPDVSTLQRWARKIEVNEGVLTVSLDFMRGVTDLSSEDKLCVLSFDEMKVAETFEYNAAQDYFFKPANYVQVVMARGLLKSWKQPVFYKYDCNISKEIILNIIALLHECGYTVVAMVCDMGPSNRNLWKSLGITIDKPWFKSNVSIEGKVFVFADAPHLLKRIRNHFLDTGLLWNGTLLTSRTVADLLQECSKSDVSITYKVTTEHLSVKGLGRQKVKLAAPLFSNTTANAIRWCYSHSIDLYEALKAADFVQLVNDWFDVLNSSMKTFNLPGKKPYGLELTKQNGILKEMNAFMSSPIIPGKKSLEYFQRGVLITNSSLTQLLSYLEEEYNVKYILSSRLNQDVLELFFGNIRSKGGFNDHPTPMEFKFRI